MSDVYDGPADLLSHFGGPCCRDKRYIFPWCAGLSLIACRHYPREGAGDTR
jgi:hypothetical protein